MLKPKSTFKLAKQTKRYMATMIDPVMRNAYKNMMIQAQLQSEIVPKREKKPRGNFSDVQTDSPAE
jgi:hypothetical protein